jgi:dipeptidyl aminopeptidase/acylaminoacyl peptidase
MQLHRLPAAGGELVRLTDFDDQVALARWAPDGSRRWAPDGSRVLLLKDEGGDERYQYHLLDPATGAVEPFLVEPGVMHLAPAFSPDGRLLAYACNRRNGTDFDVLVRDLRSGEERTVFAPGGWGQVESFSPDGRLLLVGRLTERPADNDLHLVDVESGEAVLATPHDDDAAFEQPAWLPDSSGFLLSTNSGRDVRGLARYDVAARSWAYLLEDDWDLSCVLSRDGSTLLVEANEDGWSRLELRDPATLELVRRVELPARGVVTSDRVPGTRPVLSDDGSTLFFQLTSPVEPGDVWRHDVASGESVRLTRSAGAPRGLAEPELHRFESFDGERVPVFLYRPRGGEGGEPAPVLVVIHGGPEAQYRPVWRGTELTQFFVSRGFAVAAPNVRGSTGYGRRWEHLDDVHRRLDSVRDLAALHAWLVEQGFDGGRVALYGASYGGYMVLAGLAFHPELWAAGIDVVGISSLVTFLEHTSPWRRAFREREYGSLERDRDFLHEVSPLTHVDRIRAPLFVVHGRNDPRVPVSEAEQLHRALRERGIPTELLVYDDEGHGLRKLANKLDAYPRAAAWLERVLGLR